jgi:hypothetical protein
MVIHEPAAALPARPAALPGRPVAGWREPLTLPTYQPEAPSPYPAYLHERVYQGSSGRVYPLPFHERIDPVRRDVSWDAIHLENDWIRVVVLPAPGGRLSSVIGRSNGYDFLYRNDTIEPALVGLAGPWVAGGVVFTWPQHHRPGRLDDMDALQEACLRDPEDPVAAALLGDWLYAHDRPVDAVEQWSRAVAAEPGDVISWRTLGLAAYNVLSDPERARHSYARARQAAPEDAQLLFESDQLDARTSRRERSDAATAVLSELVSVRVAIGNLRPARRAHETFAPTSAFAAARC